MEILKSDGPDATLIAEPLSMIPCARQCLELAWLSSMQPQNAYVYVENLPE
ncbi:hypothetical protein [Microbulbifer sp. THAF38]|uniref:hypothetical protein n=1 Tax=Microbulbifer sp. THAF38 TaxID=2587856 RepID=UPI0020A285EF|nr:hypothetical protein [Microbulbifer sp. THAF38]